MRIALPLLLTVLFAGCEREKSFDRRYEDTAAAIGNRANTIDRELQNNAAQNGAASENRIEPIGQQQ